MVRADLPPGLQCAQLAHAFVGFALSQPERTGRWHAHSNNLVCLAVAHEQALEVLLAALVARRIAVVPFYEPDLDGALTAVAVGPEGQRYLSSLPLALASPRR